jgi:hypothetical protein
VREPLTQDDVDEVVMAARSPEEHRAAAAQLEAWANQTHPADADVTPASLLVSAGEQLSLADDHASALRLFERAVAAEGESVPDVRCYLHNGLLQVGDTARAHRVAEEIRRSRLTDPDVYLFVGEGYELAGDLAEANRWLTLGLMKVLHQVEEDDQNELSGIGTLILLAARRRVRRTLGFPPDEYDVLAVPPHEED